MNRSTRGAVLVPLLAGWCLGAGSLAPVTHAQEVGSREWAQTTRDERLGWFRDARFGMFIHWGLYAVPGGVWNGTNHAGAGEWLMHSAKVTPSDYAPLQAQFNPVEFNADEWVRIAKAAGQKYIVITSKHHDGFALFDSALTDWDVMGTPFKRDIIKELADACEREGIVFCVYHSIMDWTHPDYLPRRSWDHRPTETANFDRYREFMKGQLSELLSGRYGNMGILWFDGEWEGTWNHEMGLDLARHIRSLQPSIIINNRVDKGRRGMDGLDGEGEWEGDYGTPEQEIPANGLPGVDWETCMTMNGSWGFHQNDHNWKSAESLVRNLGDIASKGGNFLLNVGPQPDGRIPQASIDRLTAMGDWMETNGESIYGTAASPFNRAPSWGRVTQKPLPEGKTRLYLHIFDWPVASGGAPTVEFTLPPFTNEWSNARLLGNTAFEVKPGAAPGTVVLPAIAPSATASVLAIDLEGAPEVVALHTSPAADGSVTLAAREAAVAGHVRYEDRFDNLGYWTDSDGRAWWEFAAPAGTYDIHCTIAAPKDEGGGRFTLELDGTSVAEAEVPVTNGWGDFTTLNLGAVHVGDQAPHTLTIRAVDKPRMALMNLREVRLVPAK